LFFQVSLNLILAQDSITEYYNEISSKSEFNPIKLADPIKWKKDVVIYVKGIPDSVICSELEKLVLELNDLIENIEIKITDNESEANLIAFMGWFIDYDNFEPKAKPYTANNYGLFCLHHGEDNNCDYGSFYLDIVRCNWFPADQATIFKKHLLREELTQSLGLINDSIRYSDSIFYQEWSLVTEFSELDKEIIRRHYRN